MKPSTTLGLITVVTLVFIPASLQAQALQEGTWPGTIVRDNGPPEDASFEVKIEAQKLTITYNSPVGAIPLEDIRLEGDTLSYVYTIGGGLNISCTLKQQEDGSYTGQCMNSEGLGGRHTMNPPTG